MVHAGINIPVLVKGLRPETDGHLSVIFERPHKFDYEAGDWIDISFGRQLSGGKTYSLASSPTEPDLVITFKVGQSEIKRTLQAAKPGDLFHISAYGNDYNFTLREHRNSVMIAGGVGIAPFRSMLKDMADRSITDAVNVVYLNRTEDFLFKDEFDYWQANMPLLSIDYVVTSGMKSKDKRKLLTELVSDAVDYYYIAGPPAMVEHTEHLLVDAGVAVDDIRIDSFGGY